MLSVCVDTSVLATVAVVQDGQVLAQVTDPNPRRQAEGLADLFARCLEEAGFGRPAREAGLDRIIVGTGPGPYTGLRAGLAFASALGAGLGVPVLGVSSQEILGFGAAHLLKDEGSIALVMTDARRKEVYYSVWKIEGAPGPTLLAGPAVADISVALAQAAEADGAGSAVNVFFAGPVPAHLAEPLAQVDARLVDLDVSLLDNIADAKVAADPESDFPLEPQYLRRPDVNTK